jgi:NTE family protein
MPAAHKTSTIIEPRRTILVFQGGGALGAYQAGVYEALIDAGRQPDWVVGTSIGAINGALIAANPPEHRLASLREFWRRMSDGVGGLEVWNALFGIGLRNLAMLTFGLQGFFEPRGFSSFPFNIPGVPAAASFYSVEPLAATLAELVDFDYLAQSPVRLSVGAVDVESARLVYFDSRQEALKLPHVLASGALPPAFPPVEIDGRFYWDGGIYSNTSLDWVLHDQPRDHSLCLFPTLWPQQDRAPCALADVLRREKEIQFASRADTIIEMEREMHRMRHAINLLARALAEHESDSPLIPLACMGCGSVFHVIHLEAPRLPGEDHTKDIEFATDRVRQRWEAGLADGRRALAAKPWLVEVPPTEGVMVHDFTHSGPATTREVKLP